MTRALAAFLALFSLLSLLVRLERTCELLGVLALAILSLDFAIGHLTSGSRRLSGRHMHREPLI